MDLILKINNNPKFNTAIFFQRHHETYKNLQKLKNAMYVHRKDLLNKKVQKQRIQIQMSDLRFKQILEHQGRKKVGILYGGEREFVYSKYRLGNVGKNGRLEWKPFAFFLNLRVVSVFAKILHACMRFN